MAEQITYVMMPGTTEPLGTRTRATVIDVAGGLDQAIDWPPSRASETETGNPCLGIAIGCVLSLPFWAAIAAVAVGLR